MILTRYVGIWANLFLLRIQSVFTKDFRVNKLMRHIYLEFIKSRVISFGGTTSSELKT